MAHCFTFLVLGILVLVGVAYGYCWYSPVPPLPSLTATIRKSTVRLGGRDRSYLIYVPANLPPQAALVIVLHGSGMDGARMRLCTGYEFDCLADQHGFVVIYPDGYRRNWNDCRKYATFPAKRENIDDMGFIRTLIARASIEQAIDEQQVYAFGYSNGGHMAFRLAIEAPDEIAAVGAVAANLPTPDASSCPQRGRTSRVMLINGTADPINPYQGGSQRTASPCANQPHPRTTTKMNLRIEHQVPASHAIRFCEQRLCDVINGIRAAFCRAESNNRPADS
jgi:polyhydroxybutyrate depolymerase